MSALADPKERALFVILVEHDVNVWTRDQVGVLYVGCPECGAASNVACASASTTTIVADPNWVPAPHFARVDLRQRTRPDLSDIHIKTRQRIRDLFEHDVYPEDLLT